MLVCVVSQDGKPLMPITSRRTRRWLKTKRARVVRREPFTLQLRFETTPSPQPAPVGVDTGSKTAGIAATTSGRGVLQAEVRPRTDISEKLTRRRMYRRKRRASPPRYRPARFAHRCRRSGWLPPSLRSKAEATVKVVQLVASCLPVGRVNVEVGRFDAQRMQSPKHVHLEYRPGKLQGYLLREYLFEKWQRKCACRAAEATRLEIEHIAPKSRGGSNRASNLTLACPSCNQRKGLPTAAESGFPGVQAGARAPLEDAAQVSSLKARVVPELRTAFGESQVRIAYGYEIRYKRLQVLHLTKSHASNAVALACNPGEVVQPLEMLHQATRPVSAFNGLRSEHTCWAPRKVRGFKCPEPVQAKGQVGYIGGRWEKGSCIITEIASGKKVLEVTPRK